MADIHPDLVLCKDFYAYWQTLKIGIMDDIKTHSVSLVVKSEANIKKQLAEVIQLLSKEKSFPDQLRVMRSENAQLSAGLVSFLKHRGYKSKQSATDYFTQDLFDIMLLCMFKIYPNDTDVTKVCAALLKDMDKKYPNNKPVLQSTSPDIVISAMQRKPQPLRPTTPPPLIVHAPIDPQPAPVEEKPVEQPVEEKPIEPIAPVVVEEKPVEQPAPTSIDSIEPIISSSSPIATTPIITNAVLATEPIVTQPVVAEPEPSPSPSQNNINNNVVENNENELV